MYLFALEINATQINLLYQILPDQVIHLLGLKPFKNICFGTETLNRKLTKLA